VVPVLRRAHGTVDQHGCSADDLARGRDDLGEDITDHRPQQVPAASPSGTGQHAARGSGAAPPASRPPTASLTAMPLARHP
ncbi:MAG TPA: hypothetical protein VF734_01585, partial [Pseudonocardiaceae bacterium]